MTRNARIVAIIAAITLVSPAATAARTIEGIAGRPLELPPAAAP